MTTVLHKSWIKRNVFGGTTTTTQCNRSAYLGDGMNIADSDDQVTCKLYERIIDAGRVRPSIEEAA